MGFHESQCVGLYFISVEYALLLHINMTKIRKGSVVVCILAALCHFFTALTSQVMGRHTVEATYSSPAAVYFLLLSIFL